MSDHAIRLAAGAAAGAGGKVPRPAVRVVAEVGAVGRGAVPGGGELRMDHGTAMAKQRRRGTMWNNRQVLVSFTIVVLGLAATTRSVQADLPQYCQDLMNQYATDPGQLDASALAALRDCQAAAEQARPPAQPVENPSPGATPIDQPGWGKWSPSAPWSDEKAKSGSWRDHIPE